MRSERLAVFFLSLSIIFSSCYFLPSGNPQPTDFLGLIAFISLISNSKIRKRLVSNLLSKNTLLFFVIIFSLANIFSLRFFPEVTIIGSLLGVAYIYFNVGIYLSFNFTFTNKNNHPIFLNACVLCSLIDFASIFFNQQTRGKGFMNNPNQFAVHILCLLIMSILFSKNNLFSWKLLLILFVLITPALQSGSKGALAAGLPILFSFVYNFFFKFRKNIFLLLKFLKNKSIYIIFVFIILSILFGYIYSETVYEFSFQFSNALDLTTKRFISFQDESDSDFWYGRNIYLITKLTSLDWLIGIGYYKYFERLGEDFEIHSLFPSLIVIGGIFSLLFFCLFLVIRLKKNLDFFSWSAILAIILYSITHQFFRDSGMWIVLGLMR